MSTFLQLAGILRQEVGIDGTGPSTTLLQTGELKNVVDWTSSAYNEIQNKHSTWRWLRSQFTVNTVSGTDSYAPGVCTDSRLAGVITRFARWWKSTAGCASGS